MAVPVIIVGILLNSMSAAAEATALPSAPQPARSVTLIALGFHRRGSQQEADPVIERGRDADSRRGGIQKPIDGQRAPLRIAHSGDAA